MTEAGHGHVLSAMEENRCMLTSTVIQYLFCPHPGLPPLARCGCRNHDMISPRLCVTDKSRWASVVTRTTQDSTPDMVPHLRSCSDTLNVCVKITLVPSLVPDSSRVEVLKVNSAALNSVISRITDQISLTGVALPMELFGRTIRKNYSRNADFVSVGT